jgi:histidinol-phosphate aminotransferase
MAAMPPSAQRLALNTGHHSKMAYKNYITIAEKLPKPHSILMTLKLALPDILKIEPYKPGISKVAGKKDIIKLSSNENALGASPKALAALKSAEKRISRYPDGGCVALRNKIGEIYGLNPEQIVCGAGSDEILAFLCHAYAGDGDEVLYSQHGFLMYPISALRVGATPVKAPEKNLCADVDALLASVTLKTRILFLANPNNPTGSYLSKDKIEYLRKKLPQDILLVLDAAYCELVDADDFSEGNELVKKYPNVVVTRTFSKVYGLASLRLGWSYSSPEIADVLNRVRGPFNVSLQAQEAGVAALDDQEFIAKSKAHNTKWRAWMTAELTQLGLKVYPSQGNFVLVEFPDASATDTKLKENGIIIRRMFDSQKAFCLG